MATPKHHAGTGRPRMVRRASAANGNAGGHAANEGHMDTRITKLEVILPMLATKADLESLRASLAHSLGDIKTEFERGQKENRAWMLTTVLALFIGGLTLGTFMLRNLDQRQTPSSATERPDTMSVTQAPPTARSLAH